MDVHIDEIYLRFKNILSGCRTIYDALYFAKYIIKDYPDAAKLINGMIHNKSYDRILDFRTMAKTLNTLELFESRKDVNEYIDKNIKNDYDYIQINSLMRIGNYKKIINDVEQNFNKNDKLYSMDNIDNIINKSIINYDMINENNDENEKNFDEQ